MAARRYVMGWYCAVVTATALAGVAQPCHAQGRRTPDCDDQVGLTCSYAPTAWPTAHRDSRNSDHSPFVAPVTNRVKWTALDGAAVLLAPTVGPEGHLYVTTGQGPGTSNLHVFDADGNVLWESEPEVDLEDLDSRAVGSAPLVDRDGDIYVGDANQFWAFHSDGAVKWIARFPDGSGGFVSSFLTIDGHVGGITTNGFLMIFDRADGSMVMPPFELPGGPGPEAPQHVPGLWAGGLMDPEIIPEVEQVLFGFTYEVVNTPAVHPTTGRIYINAAGQAPNVGVMYGIDLTDAGPHIAFARQIEGGSGSSPAIAPDGSAVYAVSGLRRMMAFDAKDGHVRWTRPGSGAQASPAVGPDGTIYSGSGAAREPGVLTAINPDGTTKWQRTYDDLAGLLLPVERPSLSVPDGVPTAKTSGVVSVTAKRVWVVMSLGYDLATLGLQSQLPELNALVAVDPDTGDWLSYTLVRDTNDGVISFSAEGDIYVSHAALLSSIMYYWLNSTVPRRFKIDGPPLAGISALEPVSPTKHAVETIAWMQTRVDDIAEGNTNLLLNDVGTEVAKLRAQTEGIIRLLTKGAAARMAPDGKTIGFLEDALRHLIVAQGYFNKKLASSAQAPRFFQAIDAAAGSLTSAALTLP